jgi:hypothetical protein
MIRLFKFFDGIGLYRLIISERYDDGFRFLTGESDELRITANHEIVRGRTRTLRATWTPEDADELNAYHAIDPEAELSRLMSEEIDRDIVRRLTNILNTDFETDEEVIRGVDTLNGNHDSNEDEIINEITRRINVVGNNDGGYLNRWLNIG